MTPNNSPEYQFLMNAFFDDFCENIISLEIHFQCIRILNTTKYLQWTMVRDDWYLPNSKAEITRYCLGH